MKLISLLQTLQEGKTFNDPRWRGSDARLIVENIMSGFWIDQMGKIHEVDHHGDIHHPDVVANVMAGSINLADYTNDDGEFDDFSNDALNNLASDQGWIRVSTFLAAEGEGAVGVDIPPNTSQKALKSLLRKLSSFDATVDFAITRNDQNVRYMDRTELATELRRLIGGGKLFGKEKVAEAPITGYTTFGDFSKPFSMSDAGDRKLITSPKMIQQVYKKFGNTPFNINMAFVNHQSGVDWVEHGLMDQAQFKTVFPKLSKEFKIQPDAINIVYTNNVGDHKIGMTPWIMAHRLGHAMNRPWPSGGEQFPDMDRAFDEVLTMLTELSQKLFGIGYLIHGSHKKVIGVREYEWFTYIIHLIGTMRSARLEKIHDERYGEFGYECFAQLITTGSIRFNRLPNTPEFLAHMKSETNNPIRSEDIENINFDLGYYEKILTKRFTAALKQAVGNILIM